MGCSSVGRLLAQRTHHPTAPKSRHGSGPSIFLFHFFSKSIFIYMHCMLPACLCVHGGAAGVCGGQKRASFPPETGALGRCVLLDAGAGNLSSLQEQQTTLTAEPSLRHTLLPSLPTFYFVVPRDKIPQKKKKKIPEGWLVCPRHGVPLSGGPQGGPQICQLWKMLEALFPQMTRRTSMSLPLWHSRKNKLT